MIDGVPSYQSYKKSRKMVTVTSDKLLLTMCIGKPQLWGSHPNILQAASPQISGLKPEQDLTSGNLLRLNELKLPALRFLTPKIPVNPTNERAGQAKDPGITQATTEGKTKKLPVERRPPRDDQHHNLTRKFEYSQFEPAN
ncbi:hypothetical protein DSO57_1004873 [Entomophthora muscae]|uniref:Uncharacterized protein n=1 Tax=Entomophthora muscae TaxID=34485 RepID=A0ACC2RZC3_9FUNG|nr:hypothetical protein DSO57_1004873 [Entomophthora muscae]